MWLRTFVRLAEEVSKALDTPEDFLRFGFEDDPEEFDSMAPHPQLAQPGEKQRTNGTAEFFMHVYCVTGK